ncbi:hypothetical protein WH50_18695 [Pokkaliibacter plantistimulans]|uniref:Nucleoprotein/polynucleotide-associated enzyme n=3 Tax=Pseudomonadota TaxID=1224 RepID=A0ABX5LUM3_9GAMM|nr:MULTISPECIES: DUF2058 domain-containing protein [Pokkaliibacter]MDH2433307.1 DUF2058 domain-containing protein [Pokkaliibacter sp. MBI-7]PPC76539.1 DUF2058 domain-containing protein [Pokkaliibacter plantistimulans]PXF29849.1 hypothetical protein WH50_18695 [Pokkaliibacter plantistimulans]
MASLKDQLLKNGLATKQQAQKASADKRKQDKLAKQVSKADQEAAKLAEQVKREQERQAKVQRDRELNQKQLDDKTRRAQEAEVRQLLEVHGVKPPKDADTPYNFVHGTKIKKLYVTPQQLEQLSRSQLLIVIADEGYLLVPAAEAARIEERMPERVIHPHVDSSSDDDEYPPIPDDLMW